MLIDGRGSEEAWDEALRRYHALDKATREMASRIYDPVRTKLAAGEVQGGNLVQWSDFARALERAMEEVIGSLDRASMRSAADEYDEAMAAQEIMREG